MIRIITSSVCALTILAGAALAPRSSQAQQPDNQAARDAAAAKTIEKANREAVESARRQTSAPRMPARRSRYYNKPLTEAQKKLLAPAPEDAARFAEFLKQDNTGIVKLLPSGKHEFSYTVSAQEDPEAILPIRGGGAFYSFSEKSHRYGPWSEIALHEENFVAGFAFETLGLIVPLGNVPLESVTLATPGVDYLAAYVPPRHIKEAKSERTRHFDGFKEGSFRYGSAFSAVANVTYALRSVSYKKQGRLVPDFGGIYIPHPFEYSGADVLVAFRVVRRSEDGSVTLLWKRLKKFSTPKIKRG